MKILLFIDSLIGAGAQRQLVNLAVGLQARGHDVIVATYAPFDFFEPLLDAASVERVRIGKRFRFDPMPVARLYREVDRRRPDAVVAFLRTPAVYAELVKLAVPSVRLIVSERAGVDSRGFLASDRLAGFGHFVATCIVTNSEDYRKRLVSALPPLAGRSSTIYNGVDPRFLERGEARLRELNATEKIDRPEKTTRFCVVAARANRQKAPLVLAKAASLLRARGIERFSIDWIGPVDHATALVRSTAEEITGSALEAHWRWSGPSDDTAAVYGRYDAYVSPSLYEGVANTLCEAMSSALPSVATDIADNRRILEPAEAGLLCAPDDPASLADAMQRLIEMPEHERAVMARRAHERAVELFSMERFLDDWEALCDPTLAYRTAANRRGGHVRH